MITGGTGSFGNAVYKKFLDSEIKEIRIFSRDEKKQEDMRLSINDDKVKFYVGDVRDYKSIDSALNNVDYVFHAAALKQVPSCEFYPLEAVKTNILGADNVMTASIKNNVKKVVLLSTDKAVYPINAMGMSKALMERLMISKARMLNENETLLCATRYGNVMGSRGSVIPLFLDQISRKADLTVTDPSMTRFLMSLADSVNLVIYAFENANQGDIFVQKSPASTINDLALSLKEIFKSDADLKIMGTRHGEKLYESLLSREEMNKADSLKAFFRIPMDDRGLNYSKFYSEGVTINSDIEDYTSHNTTRLNKDKVKELLLSLDFIKDALND